jgi:adenylate cyclase
LVWFTYVTAIAYGVLLPDATALRDTAETLALAEQSGDDFALDMARTARGVTLVPQDGPQREAGLDLLAKIRERALDERFALMAVPIVDIHLAQERTRLGDLDGAIGLSRAVLDDLSDSGGSVWSPLATTVLVEALLRRGSDGDLQGAKAAIERLAAVPTDPGFVLHELPLLRLRALLARARGDKAGYREFRDRYRVMATSLGFEGHMAMADGAGRVGQSHGRAPAFCDACGSPITLSHEPADYKQVKVLFANVVRSMDINCRASVVRRYGGTPLG